MKTFILSATALFATMFLMPSNPKAQTAKEALLLKQSSMPETKKTQKKVALKALRKTINPKTLEPNRKAQEVTVDSISRIEGEREGLMYIMNKNRNSTGGYFYDKPTTDRIMASMDSFYGDQYLNPYIQPNVLNGGEPTLKYYGSGDVDENDTLDVRDYNLILNSDKDEADMNGNGVLGEQADKDILKDYLDETIPYLPAHWDFLQDTTERNGWFENFYYNVDSTDQHPPGPNYDCDDYSLQFMINSSGVENISGSGMNFDVYDTTHNARANTPVYIVNTVSGNLIPHTINAIFVGGPNVDSTTNFDGWYFYEPQNDNVAGRVYPGDPSMDENSFADISRYVYYWNDYLQEYRWAMLPVINFDLEDGEVVSYTTFTGTVENRPEWQSHIHIGGEIPSNVTVDYNYQTNFSDPSSTGDVEGAASWADVFHADSTTQEGSIYDSTYYNYTIFRNWWAKSQDGIVIDTTYGSRDTTFFNRPPQMIYVQDTTKPENTYNPGDGSMSYSDYISFGLENTEWDDNSGVVNVERDSSSTQGTDPTQCNYYNFTVDAMDVATDPSENADSAGFTETIYLDDSYWSNFPSDDSIPFYYPMIPDSTGGYAEATNPVLGDIPVNYEMINSTQDGDTTQPGHYQYNFDWQWTATDTICENSITDPQHVDVFKPESMIWTYVPPTDTTTSEEGHDPSVTGGLAEASDTLLPWYNTNVTYSDSLVWAQDLDSLFYREFFAGPDIVGNSYDSVAVQPIYQVYTTGLDEHPLSGFLLYPNPATGRLFISAKSRKAGTTDITVYNSSGTRVLAAEKDFAGEKPVALNLSSLPAGLYFIRLQTAGRAVMKRFVKR